MTISEHLVAINTQMQDVAAVKHCEERLRLLAAECGILLRFCSLPWCGKPFAPKRVDHEFCCVSHKREYWNKYIRGRD